MHHRLLVLDHPSLLDAVEHSHFELGFKRLLAVALSLFISLADIFSLSFNTLVEIEEILLPLLTLRSRTHNVFGLFHWFPIVSSEKVRKLSRIFHCFTSG